MGWEDLLAAEETRALPWLGGRGLSYRGRTWKIEGRRLPPEHGWYGFKITGSRVARFEGPAEPDPDIEQGHKVVRGYLVGDRLIPDTARVDTDPTKLVEQTIPVFMVEPGLTRFSRAVTVRLEGGLVYVRQEFPQGPEADVEAAYLDRKPTLDGIAGVTPALDLAFRFVSFQRQLAELREQERQRRLAEETARLAAEERRQEALRSLGTGAGRRQLATQDFATAARAALAVSGAEFLDARPSYNRGEMVVQYRFHDRRLECTVEHDTLRIIDSGICLQDHRTGEKGDTRFTLESLPAVVAQAIREHKLVVYRHVDGDRRNDRWGDPGEDEDDD